MIKSDEIGELAAALSAAQAEFSVVPKDSDNPFFKSKYAALPDVVMAASPILSKHGLAVSQLLGHDGEHDTLTMLIMHKSGQYIGDTMRLRPVKQDPQAHGSAATYGRRYSYSAGVGIVTDEDDDGHAATHGSKPASKPASRTKPASKGNARATTAKPASKPQEASGDAEPPVTDETLKTVVDTFRASGRDKNDLRKVTTEAGLDAGKSLDQLTEDQATWVMIAMSKWEKG
jgi:hypothetical protein